MNELQKANDLLAKSKYSISADSWERLDKPVYIVEETRGVFDIALERFATVEAAYKYTTDLYATDKAKRERHLLLQLEKIKKQLAELDDYDFDVDAEED